MTSFSNNISVGNVIQIIVMVAGLGLAWGTMDARSSTTEQSIRDARSMMDGLEVRLRTLETSSAAAEAKNEERFTAILTTLSRIDARLERMEKAANE